MSWATGLILWLLGGVAGMWLYACIAERFNRDMDDEDRVAEQKRRTVRRAKKLSGEMQ